MPLKVCLRVLAIGIFVQFLTYGAYGSEIRLVKDIVSDGDAFASSRRLVPQEDRLFFLVEPWDVPGPELWRSEGQEENTEKLIGTEQFYGTFSAYYFGLCGEDFAIAYSGPSGDREEFKGVWICEPDAAAPRLVTISYNYCDLSACSWWYGHMCVCSALSYLTSGWFEGGDGESATPETLEIMQGLSKVSRSVAGYRGYRRCAQTVGEVLYSWNTTEYWSGDRVLLRVAPPYESAEDVTGLLGADFVAVTEMFEGAQALYLEADDGTTGLELWRRDTETGAAALLADAAPGSTSCDVTGVEELGSLVIWAADNGVIGSELWVSDVTSGHTAPLGDIARGSAGSGPAGLTVWNGVLYFSADDGAHGRELWRSDGTQAGTYAVRDIFSGPGASEPAELTPFQNSLYFIATHPDYGRELWRTDGTYQGTELAGEVVAGTSGSSPGSLTPCGENLFFAADDGVHGNELFVYEYAPDPLEIREHPRGAALYVGSSYTLRVAMHGGVASPEFQWLKDGAALEGAVDSTHVLGPVSLADAGTYSCVVTDGVTEVTSEGAVTTVYERPAAGQHTMDTDGDWSMSLSELLRIIQFYSAGEFSCLVGMEDGYAPGPGPRDCSPHAIDYRPQDWTVGITELLRAIQFYNSPVGAYHGECDTEDGFAPGAGSPVSPCS